MSSMVSASGIGGGMDIIQDLRLKIENSRFKILEEIQAGGFSSRI